MLSTYALWEKHKQQKLLLKQFYDNKTLGLSCKNVQQKKQKSKIKLKRNKFLQIDNLFMTIE